MTATIPTTTFAACLVALRAAYATTPCPISSILLDDGSTVLIHDDVAMHAGKRWPLRATERAID